MKNNLLHTYRNAFILLNLVGLLLFFNFSVFQKEDILKEGKLVLLELAPVDPRSLMQGDYMMLNYAIAPISYNDSIPKRGYYVVKIDKEGVARFQRQQKDKTPLENNELLIKYTRTQWQSHIGAESSFFQEGHAERYESAKYGGLRIDENGNSVLIGLFDEKRRLIK